MNIINHGMWARYVPESPPEGFPENTMFCRRDTDAIDWYEFMKGSPFQDGSVKMTVLGDIVQAATFDASWLFPQSCTLLEVAGYEGGDPQADFGAKRYDPDTGAFSDPPPVVPSKASKLGIKRALDEIGQWSAVKAAIAAKPPCRRNGTSRSKSIATTH